MVFGMYISMKSYLVVLLFIFSVTVYSVNAQFTVTSSIAASQESWNTAGAWSFPAGFNPFENFPQNDFDEDASTAGYNGDYGQFIVIDTGDDIKIPNNVVIDLSNSGIDRITLKSGSQLHFGANAKLILPSGAEIVFESGAQLIADNNSSGTFLEIGGNGVWGRQCEPTCNNGTLTGPGTIDENSDPSSPLPVELLFFKSTVNEKVITLEWATASELNFDYFAIERSLDGLTFDEIGQVQGHGTTDERHDYSFVDNSPVAKKLYYRLKTVDFDGYTEYFNIASVDFGGDRKVSIYPNPVVNGSINFTLNFIPEHATEIQITDMVGVEKLRRTVDDQKYQFSIPLSLEPGTYIIRLKTDNFKSVDRILVK